MKFYSSKDWTKAIAIAGGSLALAGLIYSLFKKDSKKDPQQSVSLDKNTVVGILNMLKREMFPVF